MTKEEFNKYLTSDHTQIRELFKNPVCFLRLIKNENSHYDGVRVIVNFFEHKDYLPTKVNDPDITNFTGLQTYLKDSLSLRYESNQIRFIERHTTLVGRNLTPTGQALPVELQAIDFMYL